MRAIVLAGALAAIAVRVAASPNTTAHAAVGAKLDNQPIRFEANIGQAESNVQYLSHGRHADLFLTPGEVLLSLHQPGPGGQGFSSRLLHLKLRGANPDAKLSGLDSLVGKANYFLGSDPSRWRVNAPTFARVKYEGIYPGVDLIFYGNDQKLEYDLVVQPTADPGVIELEFAGTQKIEIAANGDLLLRLPGRGVRQRKPVIYQEINGQRNPISGSYILPAADRVAFRIGSYDKTKPLIIDPVLTYSETFGGAGGATATSIAVDAEGNSYVTGNIQAPGFFSPGAFQTNLSGFPNAFVTKFNTNGAVVYSTYLGGSYSDYGQGIAVDTNGDAFVTGFTSSTNFPTLNALQPTNAGGNYDIFVTELNAAGNGLIYSTYLGGSSADAANSIALDSQGNAIITGYTESTNFPLANAAQKTFGGQSDAFVVKLNTNGSALVYSTYLGGSQTENIGAFLSNPMGSVAVDAAGNAYVTGLTYSTNFPVTNAFQSTTSNIYYTAFVTMFSPAGAMVRSSFLGGSSFETGNAIAVDSKGDVYVGGSTESYDFPVKNALQPNFSGYGALFIGDGFLTVFDPTGTNLLYSTYLGGSGDDQVNGIAVDSMGNVALTGFTTSPDFPLLNPTQGTGNQGFFASSNGVWTASNAGLTNGNQHTYFGYFNNYTGNVVALVVDPANPSILYLSGKPAGVFKSFDRGANWTAMNNGLAGFYSTSGLGFNPQDPSTLYAWGYNGVSVTTNGATNWISITNGLPNSGFPNVQTLAVDPIAPATLYAGTGAYGLYKSSDAGNTWDAMPGLTNYDVMALLVDPQNPAIVYAGCQGFFNVSLFQSTNFGTNWSLLGAASLPQGSVPALAVNPTNSAVYAVIQGFDSSTLDFSADHGATWSNLLESFGFNFTALAIDPRSPDTMYLGTDQNSGLGVLQSTDGGMIWMDYGLNSDLINTLAIDPADDALVYAGVNGGQDAFIATVYTNGALSFSTFFGGTGADIGNAIAVDSQEDVHVAGATASDDFPGVAVPAMAMPRNPHKLGGPDTPIEETVGSYDADLAWALRFIGILGPPPCPPGSVIMADGSQTFAGNTTYSFAAGSGFSGSVLVDTGAGVHQPASWTIRGGTVPAGLTNGVTTLYGTFSQAGTNTFTIHVIDNNGCPYDATFTFVVTNPPPMISGISPTSGPPGILATITGSGFNFVSSVTINGIAAAFNVNSVNKISFYVPIGAGAGPIVLTSPYGTASSTSAFFSTPVDVVTFGNPAYVSTLDSDGNIVLNCVVDRGSNNVTTTVHVRTQMLQSNPYLSDFCLDPFSLGYRLPLTMAMPNVDFSSIDTLVTFPPSVFTQEVTIPITAFATPQNIKYFGVALYAPSSNAVIAAPWDYTAVSIYNTKPFNPANVNINLSPYTGGNLKYKLDWPVRMDLRYSHDLDRNWSNAPAVAPPVIGTLAFKTNPVFFSAEYKPTNQGVVVLNVQTAKGPGYLSQVVTVGNTGPAAPLTNGSVSLPNVPAGDAVPIQVQSFLTVETNSITGERTTYYVSIRYNVIVIAGVTNQIPLKVDITSIGEPLLPSCNCTPWAGVVGGTVGGVQKVEAAGGAYGDCPGTTPTVTITGPGGINLTYDGGQRSFDPADDGTWTVTSVICGKTNSATITLP